MIEISNIDHKCGAPKCYNADRDAYLCPHCDIWLEKKCSNARCEFCKGRPRRPSQDK